MPASAPGIAARLDWQLGAMIRKAEQVWHILPLVEKRERVHIFRLLYDALAEVTGQSRPAITSPWLRQEIFSSMSVPFPGYWSFVGGLEMENNPLVNAVRVTERQLRKNGTLPRSLDSKHKPVAGLSAKPHVYTEQELVLIHEWRRAHT